MCQHVKRYLQKRLVQLGDEANNPERAAVAAELAAELRAVLEKIDAPPRAVSLSDPEPAQAPQSAQIEDRS